MHKLEENDKNLFVLNNPLVQHKLSELRQVNTSTERFRKGLRDISYLIVPLILARSPMKEDLIHTPITKMQAPFLVDEKFVVIPILRAGLGMTAGFVDLLPNVYEGHIGLFRHETTKEAVVYLTKLPPLEEATILLIDPMLGTGNSAVAALDILKREKKDLEKVRFVSLLAAPEGIHKIRESYPTLPIYVAAIDKELNEKYYITPGLGDAGDRVFGT